MKSSITKRSVVVNHRKTSVSLEEEFWQSLKDIASARAISVSELVSEIQTRSVAVVNLSSAIRVFIIEHYRLPFNSSVSAQQSNTNSFDGGARS